MTDTRISALPAAGALTAADVMAIVNGTATKKIKIEDLFSHANLTNALPAASSTNVGIPSVKINFADDCIKEGKIDDLSISGGEIKDGQISAAKIDASTGLFLFATSAPTAVFKGQFWADTTDAKYKLHIATATGTGSWQAISAGTSTLEGYDAGIINTVVSTDDSGTTWEVKATIDDFNPNTFLAGPTTGSAATPTARTIDGSDLPPPTTSSKGGVIIDGNGLTHTSGTIKIDRSIVASGSTKSLVTYDTNGLILTGSALTAGDLPKAEASSIGGVSVASGSGLSVSSAGAISITNSVTGSTKTKITYDNDGLVTAGANLEATDLPEHSAALLTSGTLPIARIAGSAITGDHLDDESSCLIYNLVQHNGTYPTSDFDGQLWLDPSTNDVYVYDGNQWVAITSLAAGNLKLGGVYNADESKLTSVTTHGQSVGLTVGQNLPTPTETLDKTYVVVGTAGTPSGIPNGPTNNLVPPDYILSTTSSTGSLWSEIDLSTTVAAPTAASISVASGWGGSATNVQTALAEVDADKLGASGGTVTGALEIANAATLKLAGSGSYKTEIAKATPTANRTATLPDLSGTILLSSNASIVNADISTSAAIDYSKLAALADGKILVGNGSNVPTAVSLSSDVTITSAGVATVASASTSAAGKVQLSDSVTSTSTSLAATAYRIKVLTEEKAALNGANFTGDVNLGSNTAGKDLKLFGTTDGAYILWDQSADELLTGGVATINIVKDKLKIGGEAVTTTAAELNLLSGKSAIGDASTTAAQTFTKTQSGTITAVTFSSSLALNLNTTNNFAIGQLTGSSFTLANPSALTAGASGMIKIQQHASSPITPGWGDQWHFPGGSASANLTQTAGAIDILVYTVVSATGGSESIVCDLIKDVKD